MGSLGVPDDSEWAVPHHGAVSLALSAAHLEVLVALLEHELHPVIFTFPQASAAAALCDWTGLRVMCI